MENNDGTKPAKTSPRDAREARRKAELKANMARRKAQAKARSGLTPEAKTQEQQDE